MSIIRRLHESLLKEETQSFLERSLTSADVLEFADGNKGVVLSFVLNPVDSAEDNEEPSFGSIELLRNDDGSFDVFSIKIDGDERLSGTKKWYLSDIEYLIRNGE